MTIVKRLRLLTAVLGAAAASAVIGTAVFGDIRSGTGTRPTATPGATAPGTNPDDPGRTRFANQATFTYKAKGGKTVFAWQVKPQLPAAPKRNRDILVLVDTSASQGGTPLQRARHIIDGLAAKAGPSDRISVWTANLNDDKATRALTKGFLPAKSKDVASAAAQLVETEYAAGATDLKSSVEKSLASFEPNAARQQVILFLGDGESAGSQVALTENARLELATKIELQGVSFFAVPLGIKVNPHNLHGLATVTGGAVVRLAEDVTTPQGRTEFSAKLLATLDVPVLRPEKVAFGPEVAESFPNKLPPLRADRATLVVGTLHGEAASVSAKIEGTTANGNHTVLLAERLPVADADNYFLHAVLEQWKTAPAKDAPAILAADRALALASQQFRLFREEFLSQAVFAITSARLDHAEKLYEAALKIDPTSAEANSGMQVVARMRSGQMTPDKLRAEVQNTEKLRAALVKGRVGLTNLQEPAPAAKPAEAPKLAAPPKADSDTILRQAQSERQVQEQQFRVLVDDTIRRSRQLLTTDPDTAYDDLKRQRDIILSNPALGDAFRGRLAADLEAMMQTVSSQGAAIKKTAAAERERIARTRLKMNEFEREQTAEEQTRARIDAFKQLMSQARYELAQQEAQIMIQERVSRGQSVPPEALASYMIGQAATNLREHRELVRIREDRYLLTMLQVEKSFIPYPDEPPVHFPPAAVWRELTSTRIEKYSANSLGSNVPASMRQIQSIIDGPNAERVKIDQELDTLPLRDIIAALERDHNLKMLVLEDAFKANGEPAILDKKPTLKQKLTGLTVGSFLDIVLPSLNATYIVRPEFIEITTIDNRLSEKVVRAFDVTDLVYAIPQSVNQSSLRQNQSVQNSNLSIFGQAAGSLTMLGGAIGFGGGLGGGLGGGIGGGLGIGGGAMGAGALGGNLGAMGGGGGNLGVGGGVAGVGGGAAGQFGNLGGQFGIQGNASATYDLLMLLIQEVVARGEWANLRRGLRNNQAPNAQQDEDESKILPEPQLNSIGPFQPTRSLIVRGTAKYHPGGSVKLKKPDGAGAMGPGLPGRPAVAQGGRNVPAGGNGNVVGDVGNVLGRADRPKLKSPHETVLAQASGIDFSDKDRVWQQAMDKVNLTDPRFIVAAADLMMDEEKPGHASDIIKAGIRRGMGNEVWLHDALAISLKESKASPDEIERAAMSAIDLEPMEAKGYLKAAKAADANNKPDLALAFCQRAANLEPNQPVAYANALVYAEKSNEVKADVISWASENLLRRDWEADGVDYHAETKSRLGQIVRKFEAAGQNLQVERIRKAVEQEKQRDLVVELLWQGTADLDLSVTEPSGSTANGTTKRTSGGGVLRTDVLETGTDRSEIYTAAQAFGGTYTLNVKTALGRAVGNKATVQVTKFKGTDRQEVEVFSVDLSNAKPIRFTLEGGSRTELASVPTTESYTSWAKATPEFGSGGRQGFSGGTSSASGGGSQTKTNLPTLIAPVENMLPGASSSASSMRTVASVNADRKSVTVRANTVFSGRATDLPMPKVSLLPGADGQ